MTLKYVGPHDGVDVPVHATGQTFTVMRGKTIELPDTVAEGLLEQGEDHWQRAVQPKGRGK
jgi:ABC-type uncharacterized transport system YnjBCD substrate-binding protein